jgi:hypothetical protein
MNALFIYIFSLCLCLSLDYKVVHFFFCFSCSSSSSSIPEWMSWIFDSSGPPPKVMANQSPPILERRKRRALRKLWTKASSRAWRSNLLPCGGLTDASFSCVYRSATVVGEFGDFFGETRFSDRNQLPSLGCQ